MGILSMLGIGTGGEDPRAVAQREQAQREIDARNAAFAQNQATQMQIDYLNSLRADQAKKDAELAAKDPTATRTSAMNALSNIFTPEYQYSYVPETLTDPFEKAAYDKQLGAANELIDNMIKRGVLTGTGADAARANLTDQGARVRGQLNDIGRTILEGERGKLEDIEGRGRARASALNIGEAFDPNLYGTALSTELGTFTGGLSDLYAGQVPENLFDTSTLGAIGGGKQGAGAEPLNAPGFVAPTDEEEEPKKKKAVTSVF